MTGRRAYDHAGASHIGRMKIVCATCQKDLGSKFCRPEHNGMTTHGTCLECDAALRKRLGLAPEKACRRCKSPEHADCRRNHVE